MVLALRKDAYMQRFGYQLLYIGSIGTSNTNAHALLFLFSVVKNTSNIMKLRA